MSIDHVIASTAPDEIRSVDSEMILRALRQHGNLSKACRDLGVAKTTFLDRVDADPVLADQYARAKQCGIDTMMEELLDAPIEDAQKSRLDWDRKRWHASKLFAKRYGDKIDVTSGGEKIEGWTDRAAKAKRLAGN